MAGMTSDNILLKSLVSGNDKLPFSTLSGLAGAANGDDQDASNLTDIANGIAPNSILAAIVKGGVSGVAMTKKEKAQAQRDAMNQHLQELADWDVRNKQHQQEMEDLVQSQVYSQARQGVFVDGLKAVTQGGDPQPLIDVMNGDPAMGRTVARQFGVDPSSKLVDLQVTKDRNGQDHLIGSFTDAQGRKFTAPTQIDAAKVMSAVAQPLLDQRAAEAARQSLADRATIAGIEKDEASAARDRVAASQPAGVPRKPMPASAIKEQNTLTEELGLAQNIKSDLGSFITQLDNGALKLGPLENLLNRGRNYAGQSTQESRNLASFQSSMEKMRNDSLRLNKGVQTEGDAVRAWNELFANINDPALVKQRLQEIQTINSRAADLKRVQIDQLRQNFGQEPMDYGALPSGTAYQGGLQPPPLAGSDSTPTTPASEQMLAPPAGAGMFKDGQTATNPQTGKKIVFKDGQWLPM